MIKPIWALAGVPLLGAVGVAGALFVTSPGGEEEVVQQVETETPVASPEPTLATELPAETPLPPLTPGPGITPFRWVRVTLLIPDMPEIAVLTESTPSGSPGLLIMRDTAPEDYSKGSAILIDAENGTIASSEVLEEDRRFINAILATLTVSDLNTATAAWPYNGDPPPESERQAKDFAPNFTFLPPAPDTGFHVYAGLGDPSGEFIGMRNGRSTVVVGRDSRTGQREAEFSGSEDDRHALERWAETVNVCGSEIEC